jgi:hypothetical protein
MPEDAEVETDKLHEAKKPRRHGEHGGETRALSGLVRNPQRRRGTENWRESCSAT